MIFWVIVGVVTAATLALLLRPLIKQTDAPASRAAHDVEIHRHQLAEVDRDLERGVLGESEAAAARTEIERRLLRSAGEAEPQDGEPIDAPRQRSKSAALAVLVLVPLAAVGLYVYIGAPGTPGTPFADRGPAPDDPHRAVVAEASNRVAALQQGVRDAPKDIGSWIELATTLRSLGRYDEAADAFAKVIELREGNPAVYAFYGEALMLAADGIVTPAARKAFEEALARAPGEPRSRYYIGLAELQGGNVNRALQIWVDLEAESTAEAPWLPLLRRRIAETAGKNGIDVAALRAARGVDAAPSGPSPEDMEAAARMTPEQRAEMIRGMVDRLAARLKENPDDAEGWRRLAQSYDVLGEHAKAAEARAKLESLGAAEQSAAAPPGPTQEDVEAASRMDTDERSAMIRGMVDRLAARLEENPNDVDGWLRLGRSYGVLGEREKAVEAMAKAAALEPARVDVLLDYGEAILAAKGEAAPLPPHFVALMRDVLALDRSNSVALWYLGQAEYEAGRQKEAREFWHRLLATLPTDAPERAALARRIEQMETEATQ